MNSMTVVGAHRRDRFDLQLYTEPHDRSIRSVAGFGQMVAEARVGEPDETISHRVFATMKAAGHKV